MSQAALLGVVVLMMMSSSVGAAFFMMGGDDDNKTGPTGPAPPTEYKYEFIKNIESAHTKDYNVHITDIRVDGKRVTSDQIQLHEEPDWAKCNSKGSGYECVGTNYGLNDPEPANPTYSDLPWSAWKEGQIEVGSKVMTITTLSKVKEFEIDYFRPKYVPGWIIKENGKEVFKETTNPKTVKYVIGT